MEHDVLLEMKNIKKSFNGVEVLKDISLKVEKGEVLGIIGPSGSGKSTIIGQLLKYFPQLEFSISATCRAPRGAEVNGREYYFFSHDEFMLKVANQEFVECEEVYAGTCYGTLRSELERIFSIGHVILFVVDV